MKNFLSCDWGTSSFRLRGVDTGTLEFNSIEANDKGIANVFELWKHSGAGEKGRFAFYLELINDHIKILEQRYGKSFNKAPLIISGMASSSIGMIELDYKRIPFSSSGHDLEAKTIKAARDIDRDIIIIPGVRSENDVMRGEETQLIGCDHDPAEKRTFIFPGTHSKHVRVEEGEVIDFKTYMTGEFFELLSEKSVLSFSVEQGEGLNSKKNKQGFESGAGESKRSGLLHSSFLVRTNDLFNKLNKEENYYFLSGLIIGTELRELVVNKEVQITLVASAAMKELYSTALDVLIGKKKKDDFKFQAADIALVKGQSRIFQKLHQQYLL